MNQWIQDRHGLWHQIRRTENTHTLWCKRQAQTHHTTTTQPDGNQCAECASQHRNHQQAQHHLTQARTFINKTQPTNTHTE
jgi:hypothetical protein